MQNNDDRLRFQRRTIDLIIQNHAFTRYVKNNQTANYVEKINSELEYFMMQSQELFGQIGDRLLIAIGRFR